MSLSHGTTQAAVNGRSSLNSLDDHLQLVPFGHQMRDKHFLFDPNYTPLNHGSFGTYPRYVRQALHYYQSLSESRPDAFVRHQYPELLDGSRKLVAGFLGLGEEGLDEVVLVQNASVATNTVLRNLLGGSRAEERNVVIFFSTVYSAVEKTVESLRETNGVEGVKIEVEYPIADEDLIETFRETINETKAEGKKPRTAIFDTVTSMPGVRMPWERLVETCREEKVLSFIDAAHGAGHVPMDIKGTQPDFLVTNLHKWLYVPRPCAAFYVPHRNQHLVRTTYPTSHGFVPLPLSASPSSSHPHPQTQSNKEIFNPLPPNSKPPFLTLFEFVATQDVTPYLCIEAALKFRNVVCGGEERIRQYCVWVAGKGAEIAKERFDEVFEGRAGGEGRAEGGVGGGSGKGQAGVGGGVQILYGSGGKEASGGLVNVELPITVTSSSTPTGPDGSVNGTIHIPTETKAKIPRLMIPLASASAVTNFIARHLINDYDTYASIFLHAGKLWVRFSGQVYLEVRDFERGVEALVGLVERVGRGEWEERGEGGGEPRAMEGMGEE